MRLKKKQQYIEIKTYLRLALSSKGAAPTAARALGKEEGAPTEGHAHVVSHRQMPLMQSSLSGFFSKSTDATGGSNAESKQEKDNEEAKKGSASGNDGLPQKTGVERRTLARSRFVGESGSTKLESGDGNGGKVGIAYVGAGKKIKSTSSLSGVMMDRKCTSTPLAHKIDNAEVSPPTAGVPIPLISKHIGLPKKAPLPKLISKSSSAVVSPTNAPKTSLTSKLTNNTLPDGWTIITKTRKTGKQAGGTYCEYLAPSGKRLRSLKEVERYLDPVSAAEREASKSSVAAGKKRARDPNEPKRPSNAFVIFTLSRRDIIKKDCPGISFKDLQARLGREWKELQEIERAKYEASAAAQKAKYEERMKVYLVSAERKEWEASHPQPLKKKQKSKDGAKTKPMKRNGEASIKSAKPPGLKKPRRPVKPLSAFMHFSLERKPSIISSFKETPTGAVVGKALHAAFSALSEENREFYEIKAAKDKRRYEDEMRIFSPRPKPKDERDVGKCVKVHWKEDDIWYLARVIKFESAQNSSTSLKSNETGCAADDLGNTVKKVEAKSNAKKRKQSKASKTQKQKVAELHSVARHYVFYPSDGTFEWIPVGDARIELADDNAIRPFKTPPIIKWQRELLESSAPKYRPHVERLIKEGYTTWPNVLDGKCVEELLAGPPSNLSMSSFHFNNDTANIKESQTASASAPSRKLRKRSSSQVWSGARSTINGLVSQNGGVVTARAPLCVRSAGRYDMPLPPQLCNAMEEKLREVGLLSLVQFLLKGRGQIRAQNIMLSAPGSVEQPVHTDSQWSNRSARNPGPHYLTVLIPLTDQDLQTGGTRVYPGTHRDARLAPLHEGGTVRPVEQPQKAGTALVFDGLLQHHGTANVTKDFDRYFYYMAICIGADPNTEVTGTNWKKGGKSKKEIRAQAMEDAKRAMKQSEPGLSESIKG